jgi:hypothetical protein
LVSLPELSKQPCKASKEMNTRQIPGLFINVLLITALHQNTALSHASGIQTAGIERLPLINRLWQTEEFVSICNIRDKRHSE